MSIYAYSKVFSILITFLLITLTGCSELGINATQAANLTIEFTDENKHFDDASKCVIEMDSSIEVINDEIVDTITIELEKDCIDEIITTKIEEEE